MSTISIGKMRYDIISDTTGFEKGARASRAEIKMMDRAFRNHAKASQKTAHELERLAAAEAKAGGATSFTRKERQRLLAQQKAELALERQIAAQAKKLGLSEKELAAVFAQEAKSVKDLNKQLEKLTGNKKKNSRAGGSPANFAGSAASMFGLGGAGAGMARTAAHMGAGGIIGGATLAGILSATNAYAKLEKQIVDIQVIMGDKTKGAALVQQLREIAKVTPLTTSSLIKSTQTMLGYGLESEHLVEITERLGAVSGGNAEKMQALTIAFSQISAQGKLMGQELIQLVNAGFPVAEIARAAGVEMKDFRKEMEKGTIKAHHFIKALVNITSEGGLMAGRLEEQSKTISGAYTIAFAEIEEAWVKLGKKLNEKMDLADSIKFGGKSVAEGIGGIGELIGGVGSGVGGVAGFIGRQMSKEAGATEDLFSDTESVQQVIGRFLGIVADRVESYAGGGTIDPETGKYIGIRAKYWQNDIRWQKKMEANRGKSLANQKSRLQEHAEAEERANQAAARKELFEKKMAGHEQARKQAMYDIMALQGKSEEADRLAHIDKLKLIAEEQNWTAEDARQRMKLYDDVRAAEKAAREEEERQEAKKAANEKKLEAAKDNRDRQIQAIREKAAIDRQEVMAKKSLNLVAGADATGAGADYAFIQKRQQARIEYIERMKLEREKLKKLDEIKKATQAKEAAVNKTFKTIADNLKSIGD